MSDLLQITVSLVPVLLFLISLILMDSYKLVSLGRIVRTIVVGAIVALVCMLINSWILESTDISLQQFRRYVAPFVEECLKALFVIYLVRSHRVGFMVDAAIHGFAIGAGFAVVENIVYWQVLDNSDMMLWVLRGFGTAALHGGTMTLFAIIGKNLSERKPKAGLWIFLPGLAAALILHSAFNHFFLPAVVSTMVVLVTLGLLITVVFYYSEHATRNWLGHGLDADMKLFEAITTGKILDTRVGEYIDSLYDHFPITVVADMVGLLRIHLELAAHAKGLLLMRRSGLKPPIDPDIKEKFKELRMYQKQVGKTGCLALAPYLQTTSQDLWQIYMLEK